MEQYKAPKIIALEIDEYDLESGADGIALVASPAIESDFYYFSKNQPHIFESYTDYPKAATENAKIALRWAEENGWGSCGTAVGKARANQLAKGEPISEETISRMAAFERHRQNSTKELGDGCGRLMWLAWGGDEGIEWAQRKLKQIRQEQSLDKFVENAGGFSIGDYVSWTYAGRSEGDDRGRGQIKDLRIQGKLRVPGTDFELSPTEDRPAALIETRDGSLVGQYTDNLRKIQKPDDFDGELEIDVYGYSTRYFYMCPGAVGTFLDYKEYTPDGDTRGMIRSAAQIADNIFRIEHEVITRGDSDLEELGEAQTLVDDYYDLIDEIDKILGITSDVSYMEGHLEVIRKYIDEMILEYLIEESIQEKKYISNLPTDTQDKLLERLDEVGESLSQLEKEGWVVMKDEQEFAMSSKPNQPSIEDYGKFKIRYKYTGPKDSKNRTFCRRLLDKDLVFRKEDINNMTLSGENSEFGVYDIFTYKGSYGCRHYWQRLVMYQSEGKEVTEYQEAEDAATSVNPLPTMNRNPNSSTLVETFSEQSKEKQLIAGPLMIPRKLIYRFNQETDEEFWVYFTEDTIEKIAYKYLMNKYQDNTNLEHSEDIKLRDVVLVESWIVEDPEKDKSYFLTGQKYAKGTWFGIMKVLNSTVWKEWVKTGRVKGFSIEGYFSDRIINASKHKFYYRTTKGGSEIVIDHETLVVFILEDGERKAILPDGNYELDNGKTLQVRDSKAVKGSF